MTMPKIDRSIIFSGNLGTILSTKIKFLKFWPRGVGWVGWDGRRVIGMGEG